MSLICIIHTQKFKWRYRNINNILRQSFDNKITLRVVWSNTLHSAQSISSNLSQQQSIWWSSLQSADTEHQWYMQACSQDFTLGALTPWVAQKMRGCTFSKKLTTFFGRQQRRPYFLAHLRPYFPSNPVFLRNKIHSLHDWGKHAPCPLASPLMMVCLSGY